MHRRFVHRDLEMSKKMIRRSDGEIVNVLNVLMVIKYRLISIVICS